jgi:hypothetical protein
LLAGPGGLVFAGSQRDGCAANGERPLLGQLGADLTPRTLWTDSGLFYGHLVSVAPAADGYVGVANVSEPLDVAQPSPSAAAVNAATKYPDGSNAELAESVLIRFDAKGAVKEKIFLGNGLPEYAQGLVRTGANAYAVYGSDGFNPWLEAVN